MDLGRILPLSVAGLGVLAFFFGFLSAWKRDGQGGEASISVYSTAGSYLPILLLLVGLLALAPLLPKGRKYTLPTALLAIVGFLAALTQLISGGGAFQPNLSAGIGLILLIVVALLQAGAAAYGWLTESGLLTAPPAARQRPRARKPPRPKQSEGAQSAQSEGAQFAPTSPTSASGSPGGAPAPLGAPAGYGSYPPAGYGPGGPDATGPRSDPAPYGGYRPNPYSPAGGPSAESRNPYATREPAPPTGPVATPTGPAAGTGRDDGPSPDETQQVRF